MIRLLHLLFLELETTKSISTLNSVTKGFHQVFIFKYVVEKYQIYMLCEVIRMIFQFWLKSVKVLCKCKNKGHFINSLKVIN